MSVHKKHRYFEERKYNSMTKRMKTPMALLMALAMCLSTLLLPVSAANTEVSPCLSHLSIASFGFVADEDGGEATVSYDGYESSFVKAVVTFKLQKKYMLFFWEDLGEWTGSSTELHGFFCHVFPLDGKGTYKMNMSLAVVGNDGSADVIEDSLERTYS